MQGFVQGYKHVNVILLFIDNWKASNSRYKCEYIESINNSQICENYTVYPEYSNSSEVVRINMIDPAATWERAGIMVFSGCFGIGCLTFVICYVYHTFILKIRCDSPKFYLIPRYFQNIGDFWTDLFFSVILYFKQRYILSILALFFTIFPFILQCVFGIKFVIKWKYKRSNASDDSQRLLSYFKKYEILIYLSTIFAGFYNTCDLFKSKIFYKKWFSMPLKTNEYDKLRKYRFLNIAALENVPQLFLQCIYVFNIKSNGINDVSPIVFISMTLSILSILFAIVKESARISDKRYENMNFTINYTHTSRMCGYFIIESSKLNYYHNFCHKKIEQCLRIVMDSCADHKCWTNTGDFTYSIEVYYIKDMISNLDQCRAYFEVVCKYHQRKRNHKNNVFKKFYQNINDMGSAGTTNHLNLLTV